MTVPDRMTVAEGSLWHSAGSGDFERVRARGPSVVAIGKFDGVHRGHQQLLVRTLAEARRHSLRPGVVTFDTHPSEVLHQRQHRYLTLQAERLALLAAARMQFVVLLRSTPELFAMSPAAFVDALVAAVGCQVIVVGANFRFGKGAAGTPDTLRSVGARHGTRVVTQGLIPDNATVVSSTRIHRELAAGRLADVAALLGRPFSVSGTRKCGWRDRSNGPSPCPQSRRSPPPVRMRVSSHCVTMTEDGLADPSSSPHRRQGQGLPSTGSPTCRRSSPFATCGSRSPLPANRVLIPWPATHSRVRRSAVDTGGSVRCAPPSPARSTRLDQQSLGHVGTSAGLVRQSARRDGLRSRSASS